MKKGFLSLILVLILLVSAAPVQALAAGYPLIYFNSAESTTVIPYGETGTLKFSIYPVYINEEYRIHVYDSDGNTVAKAENSIVNKTTARRNLSLSLNTVSLNLGVGTYTVEYYMRYYSLEEWHECPNRMRATIKVVENICSGEHDFHLNSVLYESTCTTEGSGRFVCADCGYVTVVDLPLADHSYDEGVVTTAPTTEADGVRTFTCTECDATRTEAIPALTITRQPADTHAFDGEKASTSVAATGDGLTYQWYVRTTGASSFGKSSLTTAAYATVMNETRDGYQVYCVVSDAHGNSVTSDTVTLSLARAAAITGQPQSASARTGEIARTTIEATGDGLTYQWYVKVAGASNFGKSSNTTTTYAVAMNDTRNGNQVYCVVTDRYGNSVTSDTATLTLAKELAITGQPADAYAYDGEAISTSVTAEGEDLTYQWYVKAAGASGYSKSSNKTAAYRTTMNEARDGYTVYCVVTDRYGETATSETAVLTMANELKITAQPESVAVKEGAVARASVTATGDGLTYQWYVKVVGASKFGKSSTTAASYAVTMNDARNGNQVYCVVTDQYGNSVTSDTATLSMQTELEITGQPADAYAYDGKSISTTVTAEGDGLTYQWYVKAAGASGYSKSSNTSATYRTTMNAARDGYTVYCVVTDRYGATATSETAVLTMAETLQITSQPKSVTVKEGATAKVTVAASGEGLSYQWYVKAVGASKFGKSSNTTASYAVTMNDARNGNQVYCVVTDKYGSAVTSSTATLSMQTALKITKQPADASAADGEAISTSVSATGDGLSYQWYVKAAGASSYGKSSITSATYKTTMNSTRDGYTVYCAVTDKYGNTVKSSAATLTME